MSSLSEKILNWSENDATSKYIILNQLLEYLGENLFFDYEPTSGPYHDFTSRLNSWLENVVNEEDQKLLFELVEKIFYVGAEEFKSLYRAAFNSVSKRWLIDSLGVTFENPDFDRLLKEAINSTWFCPITDSFRINQFYHVNQITSKHSFRPDWRSLKKMGNEAKIKQYISGSKVKYLVLLEDFVGSGTQVLPALKFAASICPDEKILFVPLILCPNGYSHITKEMKGYDNFVLQPVILLKETDLINSDTVTELKLEALAELLERIFYKVKGSPAIRKVEKSGPYGYKGTGGITVMYANAPNNSLPIIVVESNTWTPLFKRHSRD